MIVAITTTHVTMLYTDRWNEKLSNAEEGNIQTLCYGQILQVGTAAARDYHFQLWPATWSLFWLEKACWLLSQHPFGNKSRKEAWG